MSALSEFLQKKAIAPAAALPLVHTTRAVHLKKFQSSNQIIPQPCEVFREDLNYFFVGRPAYKSVAGASEAEYWELPACFILSFDAIPTPDRIFPFDTGAFNRRLMPSFFQCLDMQDFEVGSIADAPQKIIGAYFGTVNNYFQLEPKSKGAFESEFSLGAFDEEIKALHRLALYPAERADDRRFCVEVQTRNTVSLSGNKLLAVVCPGTYLDEPSFRAHVEDVWKAEPISYSMAPLNYHHYVSQIYEGVRTFFKQKKLIA